MEYTSLYRRFRPRRFSEIRGQEHVVAALRNAVRDDRVQHAYLLSGPRGTGKTTAARILAKALNCLAPVDGEPCCECEPCLAVDAGTSFDLHELDAASNNKVDDMRDLLGKVALGTPGRTKVYLLDEVHMLTSGAENALLKTLEEPPDHVVFVLATTEPHKVVETIRSRAQHLELNLLSAETLGSLVADVVADAGLDVDDEGMAHAVRSARGSARDALSALDRVVAGGVTTDDTTVADLLTALATADAGAALGALAAGIGRGREPRVLGEALLAALREAFLVAMGVPPEQLADADRDRARSFAEQVTPAMITGALETLGSALVAMRRAPDPRVDLEVALVRLTSPASSGGSDQTVVEALTRRIDKLEKALADAGPPRARTAAPPPQPPAPHAAGPAAAARAILAQAGTSQPPLPPPSPGSTSRGSSEAAPTESSRTVQPAPQVDLPTSDDLVAAWEEDLSEMLPRKARARFSAARFVAVQDGSAIMALPNEPHRRRCAELVAEVESVLAARFGVPIPVTLTVDDTQVAPGRKASPTKPVSSSSTDVSDEVIDPDELVDADDSDGSAVEKLTEAFPGASLVDPT
ncbi:MAG: DNA polymerase III subunit gamma/tau [Acidimicrobiales bacterium]|jgi:DNA polymerase-3 subunit gamma/tau|nr:DNA polymerase III subunit gamma/tau [Acidimicrobiales bacterium]|tara:strand:- start:756 stop:2504 length:1749 start_codon:yes stop_codon:yes gene_type:complete